MSMIGNYAEITPVQLDRIRESPRLIPELLAVGAFMTGQPHDDGVRVARRVIVVGAAMAAALALCACARSGGSRTEPLGKPLARLCIEKMWQAVHFTLTGSAFEGAPPLSYAVLGGKEVGGDVGYGPARYLAPVQVAQASEALRVIDRDHFAQRFDPAALKGARIYPEVWDEDRSELLDETYGYFEQISGFFQAAASRRSATLFWID